MNTKVFCVLLAMTIGTEQCLSPNGEKHVEPPQYRAIPQLVGNAWNLASAGTATATLVYSIIPPDQFL
jgi:hypothetical protein